MTFERRIVHILDDLAMGGVTRALKNFEHPTLAFAGQHETVDIRHAPVRATAKADIAVVHFTANWKKLGWLLDLKLRGRFSKIILIEHTYTEGFEASEVEQKHRFRLMLKCAYRLVDRVVAVSNTQREWMLRHQLAKADKVIAIPQSRECDDLFKLDLKTRDDGPLQIGAFGRFHKQKGFDLLIEAMARVPASVAKLKIAGTGPEINHLKLLAKDLPHVEICEPFSSPDTFLNGVDVVAIPSRWEAFGLVGSEARAAGRPIIAARIDGLADQLDRNAFAHAPGSISSIVRAIHKAAQAQNFDARSKAARCQAAGEFRTMVGQWLALFVNLSTRDERPNALDLSVTV
ncbi:MAG: glycosyltransferase family 4 protein [Pseudomonadota bacterium]